MYASLQAPKTRVEYLTQAGLVAALYTALTLAAMAAGLAFGPIQLRFSEALTVLPVFMPAAVPGLAIGCLLANLWSNLGAADIIFGTLATLLAALSTRALRGVCFKGLPVLAPLPPVLFNAVIIGLEIALLSPGGFSWASFFLFAAQVGLGQLLMCCGLGLPFAAALGRVTRASSRS